MESGDTIFLLTKQVQEAVLPEELREKIVVRLGQLAKLHDSPSFLPEIDLITKYIEWVSSLPWETKTEDELDLAKAKDILNASHYGLQDLKDRIVEYMSVMRLSFQSKDEVSRAPILFFVGLVGTGKTTIAASIAEALGRKFARIPFGGMGDPLDLRGQSKVHPEAEPGRIMKALRQAGSRNPVILLDEIDRVADTGRASIMGVLVELLDPKQNHAFLDHYIDYPFDLSNVLFIATANNTRGIATAVLDRLEPLAMPSYNDEEKITIAKQYVFPKALRAAGIDPNSVEIQDQVWSKMVRPLGYDAGIRTLERTISGIVRKIARKVVENGEARFVITEENVREYLPKVQII